MFNFYHQMNKFLILFLLWLFFSFCKEKSENLA
jgi:hypothetical protein